MREVVEVNTRTATTAAPSVFSEVPANDDRCKIDVDMPKVLKKGLKKVLKSHQGCLRHCTTLFNLMHRSVSNLLSPNWPEVMRIVELSSLSGLNEAMPSGLPHRRFLQNPMLNLYDLTGWVSRSWMFGQFWSQVIREKPEVREREKVVEAAKAQERRWTTNFYNFYTAGFQNQFSLSVDIKSCPRNNDWARRCRNDTTEWTSHSGDRCLQSLCPRTW